MRIRPIFAWFDFWVGLYWDSGKRRLYIFPVPMVGAYIEFGPDLRHFGQSIKVTAGERIEAGAMVYTEGGLAYRAPMMTIAQYHENNAVGWPEFMHIRGREPGECPGCLYWAKHGRTPFGTRLAE